MNPTDFLAGSLISFIVSGLKKISLVKKHPRVATAVLSTIIPAGLAVYSQIQGVDTTQISDVVTSVAVQFTAAIATHETVVHEVNKLKDPA